MSNKKRKQKNNQSSTHTWNTLYRISKYGVGIIIGLIIAHQTVPKCLGIGTWNFIIISLCALISDNILGLIRIIDRKQTKELINDIDIQFKEKYFSHIMNSLDRLSPYVAFHTDEGNFESLLRLSENIPTKTKWIVPLFISHKLSKDFLSPTKIQIVTSATEYSEIINELLPFTHKSIYMTCPYTPKEWFENVFEESPEKRKRALTDQLDFNDFPPHAKAFLSANVTEVKKRFVIIAENKLNDFFSINNRQALKCFLRFSMKMSDYSISTRFAYEKTLCKAYCSCGLANVDYQMFDQKAVIKWNDPTEASTDVRVNGEEKLCTLILEPEHKYLKLFDNCFMKTKTMSAEELASLLERIENQSDSKPIEFCGVTITKDSDSQLLFDAIE